MNAHLIDLLGATLLHFLWQGAILAVLHGFLQASLRRQSASVRYLAACAAMLAGIVCVLSTFQMLKPALEPVLPVFEAPAVFASPSLQVAELTETSLEAPQAVLQPVSAAVEGASSRIAWQAWTVAAWLTGVFILSMRLGLGWLALARLRSGAEVIADAHWQRRLTVLAERLGVRHAVALLTSTRVDCPLTLGWLRPAIVVPVSMLAGIPREQMEMILAHELAHIRRGDFLVHALQCAIETLLFFHPVVWWIGADLRRLREECCDDLALRCGSRETLARALLTLEEARAPALAQAACGNGTLVRVRRLLGAHPSPPLRWKPAAAGILAVLFAITALHSALAAEVIEVKPGESIQKALDAAPEGAVIKLAAGVFPERITLRKAVTLEGGGKAILRPDKLEPGVTPQRITESLKKWREAQSEEEQLKFATEYQNKLLRPTLLIENTQNITVRGIRIQGVPPASEEEARNLQTWVKIMAAGATLEDCAIIGPVSDGITITDGSKVRLTRCLVAAVWGTGVAITNGKLGKGKHPTVDIEDCDIRNCYHRCITISAGCDDVRISRCRVSGSAWHGIRYDDASPSIEQCLIFGNARCGIYASGKTKAKIHGNLFYANEMGGMSCWFANEDEIEGNTFAGNLREGASVLGKSKPVLRRNLFALNPVSFSLGKINRDSSNAAGEVVSADNIVWKNEKDEKLPAGAREADPKLADAAAGDFRLATDSPLRAEKIGADDLPSLNSPWPLQAEEKRIIPAKNTRNYSDWQMPGKPTAAEIEAEQAYQRARTESDGWTKDALQIEDATKRQKALSAILAGLSSPDQLTRITAVLAFNRLGVVEFDRAPFRELFLPMLESQDHHLCIGAARALKSCGYQPGDLARLLKLAERGSLDVQENIAPYLVEAARGKMQPGLEPALLRVLAEPMIDRVRKDPTREPLYRETMTALGRLDLTPALKARLLVLSRDATQRVRRIAFHHAFAPQKLRVKEDVDTLAAFLPHEDTQGIVSRALWAFQQTQSDDLKPQIAALMIKFIDARSDATLRLAALKALAATAGVAERSFCEKLLQQPALPADQRSVLENIMRQLKAAKP